MFREELLESLRDTHIALQRSTEAGVVEWSRNQAVRHAQVRPAQLTCLQLAPRLTHPSLLLLLLPPPLCLSLRTAGEGEALL